MKEILVHLCIACIFIDLVYSQQLELLATGLKLTKIARLKAKGTDKIAIKYGKTAVAKAAKGTVQGVIGKPLKLIGLVLGPLGLPIKAAGKVLETKAGVNKAKAVAYTVKKLSRDSFRYG